MRVAFAAQAEPLRLSSGVRALVKRLRAEQPALAAQLAELVEAYRLDKIAALCETAEQGAAKL